MSTFKNSNELIVKLNQYFILAFVAEVGDYDHDEHGDGAGYLSEFKFCPKQVVRWKKMLLAKIIIHPPNIRTGKCLFTKWRSLFFIYLLFVLWTFCQKMVWLLVLSSLVTCLLDIAWILQVEVSCLLLLWVKGLIWIVFLARWDAAESTPVSR